MLIEMFKKVFFFSYSPWLSHSVFFSPLPPSLPAFLSSFCLFSSFLFFSDLRSVFSVIWNNYISSVDLSRWQITHKTSSSSHCFSVRLVSWISCAWFSEARASRSWVPRGSIPRDRGQKCWSLKAGLASWYFVTSVVFCWLKQSQGLPGFMGEERSSHLNAKSVKKCVTICNSPHLVLNTVLNEILFRPPNNYLLFIWLSDSYCKLFSS